MREIATALSGIFILIFAYLLLTSQNTTSILTGLSSSMDKTISTLQGR